MSNFTLQDAGGSAVAVVAFALALYTPGYLLGLATDLFGFRQMSEALRTLWAIAYSFAFTPILAYFAGKYLRSVWFEAFLIALMLAFLLLKRRAWRPAFWRLGELPWVAIAVCAWCLFVFTSLADLQVAGKLYFSVVQFDQSYRVAFTDAVLRTGVPPANPLYFAGHAQPMRYYYFWYVVCATVARVAHVSARQAFIASSVWAGLGLFAMIGLYARYFFGVVAGARRWTLLAACLLAVTGADLLPAIGSLFAQPALNGDMEWWSLDQFSSWQDSLLWVPHHTAALLCCLLSFLVLWMAREAHGRRERWGAVGVASVAFASAFGLSIYVAAGFGLLMVAMLLRASVGRWRDGRFVRLTVAAGLLAMVMLAPFLHELTSGASRTESGASAQAAHMFALSVRRMIDPELLTGLPLFAGLQRGHPVLLDTGMRLLLLLPGLALELGFFAAVLAWWWRDRRGAGLRGDAARSAVLFLVVCGLVMVLFVRSSVISNNDFGYRAAMLPQFFLLLMASDMLAGWRTPGTAAVVGKTRARSRIAYALIGLGLAGTVYQAVALRFFLPFQELRPENGFSRLPTQVYQARTAFAELDRVAARDAVIEFNPVDPQPGTRGDVVSPYTFYARSLMMNAGRQILSAEPKCASEFGGDSGPCAAIEESTARLYASPSPSAAWAVEYCRKFGVQYLAAGEMDPVWGDTAGWARTLPVIASQPAFRIVRCGSK